LRDNEAAVELEREHRAKPGLAVAAAGATAGLFP